MIKKGVIKLKIYACKANPSPPIGPVLGQKGINIISFCKDFNKISEKFIDLKFKLSVFIFYYDDKSYKIIIKKPTFSDYFKYYLNIKKFSDKSNYINYSDLKKFIIFKISDFNFLNYYSIFKFIKSSFNSLNLKFKNDKI